MEVRAGQVLQAGEITGRDGREVAFEYISNLQRLHDRKGQVITNKSDGFISSQGGLCGASAQNCMRTRTGNGCQHPIWRCAAKGRR